jgi:hypothetical protein
MIFNPQKKHRGRKAVMLFIVGYVAAHFALSRISVGMVQRDWGIPDEFIYLPLRPDIVADHENPLLYIHHVLRCLFFPIWKLDQCVGGPWPMWSMPLRNLSDSGVRHERAAYYLPP